VPGAPEKITQMAIRQALNPGESALFHGQAQTDRKEKDKAQATELQPGKST
jgi:hypothetical protein